jgi:hypothetical protein
MHDIQAVHVNDFISLTIGIIVYFVGVLITRRSGFLRRYNIPEPVTGGLAAEGSAAGHARAATRPAAKGAPHPRGYGAPPRNRERGEGPRMTT